MTSARYQNHTVLHMTKNSHLLAQRATWPNKNFFPFLVTRSYDCQCMQPLSIWNLSDRIRSAAVVACRLEGVSVSVVCAPTRYHVRVPLSWPIPKHVWLDHDVSLLVDDSELWNQAYESYSLVVEW